MRLFHLGLGRKEKCMPELKTVVAEDAAHREDTWGRGGIECHSFIINSVKANLEFSQFPLPSLTYQL